MTGDLAAQVAQLCAAGQDDLAIEIGERLVVDAPGDVDLRLRLGFVYGALERFDEAFAHLDAAEHHAEGARADVFAQRANLESFSGRGQAKPTAARAIEIEPLQPQWVYFLAEHPLQGDFLVLDDAKVVFSPVPKSASTSLKQLFRQLEPSPNGERAHQQFGGERLRLDRLRLPELNLEDYYRFAIQRDDLDRFVSYYRRNVEQSGSLRRAGHDLDSYLGLSTEPGIDELATNLARYQYVFLDVRHHTLPSRAYVHSEPDFYNDVFALDELDQLAQRLRGHTGDRVTIAHKLRSLDPSDDALNPESVNALDAYFGY